MFGLGYKSRRKLSFTKPTLPEGLVWLPYVPMCGDIEVLGADFIPTRLISSQYSMIEVNNDCYAEINICIQPELPVEYSTINMSV